MIDRNYNPTAYVFRVIREQIDEQTVRVLSPEARFNQLKDRLIAATGSPGLTSFHEGKVHMTLSEWERLVELAESARTTRQVAEAGTVETPAAIS